jgi:hypothetical protein
MCIKRFIKELSFMIFRVSNTAKQEYMTNKTKIIRTYFRVKYILILILQSYILLSFVSDLIKRTLQIKCNDYLLI